MPAPTFALLNETALICTLPPPASLEKQRKLWAFADAVREWPGVSEAVVGMNNLTVFTGYETDLDELAGKMKRWWPRITRSSRRRQTSSRRVASRRPWPW